MAILPSGVILGRLTSLCQEGLLFSSSLVHSPFRTPFPFPTARSLSLLQPQDAIARLAVVAARTLAVPALTQLWICRVGIWQYKMSLPLLRLATLRHDVLRHPARPPPRIYTKTNSGFLRAERSGDNFARLFRTELIVSTRTAALPYIYYISYNFTFLFPLTKNYF